MYCCYITTVIATVNKCTSHILSLYLATRKENLMLRRPQDVESCKYPSEMRFKRAYVQLKPVLAN